MENILLTQKGMKVYPFFLVRRKLPFFGQNCSLPFSLRSLDIPALLKSWQKHYSSVGNDNVSFLEARLEVSTHASARFVLDKQ
jgi:hypothetical protein